MSKKNAREFKKQQADNLRAIAEVLDSLDISTDAGLLRSAASACSSSLKGDDWEYRITKLYMRADQQKHISLYKNTNPNTNNIEELIFILDVEIGGKCVDETGMEDPIDHLSVECRIEATCKFSKQYSCAWHLDKNIGNTQTESKNFVHPMYHFQFGGRSQPENLGDLLFIEPPRLVHPPMDAVLAIDFVLSNYFPLTWQRVRQESKYMSIIRTAQHYFWKPYLLQLNNWSTGKDKLSSSEIWPHLL